MEIINKQPMDQMRFARAQKRVKAIAGFYKHFAIYAIINTVFIVMQAVNSEPDEKFLSWSTFSMAFFWGIGLLTHALSTFGPGLFFGSDWEERKIKQILDRDKRADNKWE